MANALPQLNVHQANWHTLLCLLENLPPFVSLDIWKEGETIKIEINTPELNAKATIREGKLVDCTIPPKTDGLFNYALIAQFFMMIQPEIEQTFKVRLLTTIKNGLVGLHQYEGERKVLSLSNNESPVIKFIVKDMSLVDMERYLMNFNYELVVIHTKGTQFAGVIGHLVLSIANKAYIRVGEEFSWVPTDNWSFLQNILPMF